MSTIRSAIERADQSKHAMAEQKEAIRALEELGRARSEIFIRDIQTSLLTAGKEESNKTVPITFVVGNRKEIRAFSSSEVDNIGNVVSGALNSFLSGNKTRIINGVGSLITDAMKIFLGAGEASSDTIEMYYVATDGLSPVRIDIKAWYYSATAESIRTSMERITTIVAVKSVIDITRVDLGTFLYLFEHQLNTETMTSAELEAAINEAADVYNVFVERASKKGMFNQQRVAPSQTEKEDWAKSMATPKSVKEVVTIIEHKLDL